MIRNVAWYLMGIYSLEAREARHLSRNCHVYVSDARHSPFCPVASEPDQFVHSQAQADETLLHSLASTVRVIVSQTPVAVHTCRPLPEGSSEVWEQPPRATY